jgi:hypothetical protein
MFQALLTHPQEVLHMQYTKCCLWNASWGWASNAWNMYMPLILTKLNKKCIMLVSYWYTMMHRQKNIKFVNTTVVWISTFSLYMLDYSGFNGQIIPHSVHFPALRKLQVYALIMLPACGDCVCMCVCVSPFKFWTSWQISTKLCINVMILAASSSSSSSIGPRWLSPRMYHSLFYYPALDVPTCTARRPHIYNDARDP